AQTVAAAPPAAPASPAISALPKLRSGVPAYAVPLMAVGRTPYTIAPLAGKAIDIQTDHGYPGGFSGFVDTAVGSLGYPGYRNFVNLEIAYDAEKLCLVVSMPYPVGRKTRAQAAGPGADLLADDVFELLLDPRDDQGRSRGPVYRVVGNAAGVCKLDQDLPQIGQFHQPWQPAARYGSMMWDPMGSWMGAVQIPFKDLGGAPKDGDIWGVQAALRYADPRITAVLSPSDDFTDRPRMARVRFDARRRANYRCHWLNEAEIKQGTFCVGGIFSNAASEPAAFQGRIFLYQGDRQVGQGEFHHEATPLAKYDGDMPPCRVACQPAGPAERNTVARIVVVDKQADKVVYDQFVPFWRMAPGERDWLKQHFGRQFTLDVGPYPSCGAFDYRIDCQTLREANPRAARAVLTARSNGRELARHEQALPGDGKIAGTVRIGPLSDGASCTVVATIVDTDGKPLSTKTETFQRTVMPFEKAPKAGVDDLLPSPFTPPVVRAGTVSCVGRTYGHGAAGLLTSLVAAEREILASPAVFRVKVGDGPATALRGDVPTLRSRGKGQVDYRQVFRGAGLQIAVQGVFDYDGFYRFRAELSPDRAPADLRQCCLEVPLGAPHATLLEAPVEWLWPQFEKCAGFLEPAQGRLWDSKRFPFAVRQRKGNMPPFCWVGDDDRGLCYSCASEEGMHNDDSLPAATVDREGAAVVFRAWFVNKPLALEKPRTFEFALQASPFKPLDPGHRLWRCGVTRDQCVYKQHGRCFHSGWGIGDYYPTYGRCLDLAANAAAIRQVIKSGYDFIAAYASSCSECGGTPEYKQFWREWGSDLGWDKLSLSPLPDWIEKRMAGAGVRYDGYVAVESASNSAPSNLDYRAWWFQQVARHCQTSMIYQDNPPYGYYYQPLVGYGYTRDDGAREPSCATWNAREFMRRALAIAVQCGSDNPAPGVYPNVCGSVQPGRSFCFRGLTGEYLESDRIPLGTLRVWLSEQWGMNIDWLMQEPNAGATLKYWRALCSRLFLLDVTSFSRTDSADQAACWLTALDLFWLDDPTVVWHPYFRNPTLRSTRQATTLVSTYTAAGRALLVVSNQAADEVLESVTLKDLAKHCAGKLRHYYDAETGEEIEVAADGALRLYVPGRDFRAVLGFRNPWPSATKNLLAPPGGSGRQPDLPPQSALDARRTLTALCRQLLASPQLTPVAGGHRLTEAWVGQIVAEMEADAKNFVYLDEHACADVDLGDKGIRLALLYDKKRQVLLVAYFNPTDTDRLLKGNAREALNRKVGRTQYAYVLDPVRGTSQWNVIDLPARTGRLEVLYADYDDYRGVRRGPFAHGTIWSNLHQAIEKRTPE
ncbi:MAG: hypothetical protein ABSG68_03895, partial [Thermoguttaceae bacterium]